MKKIERTIEITDDVKEVIIKYKDNTEEVINNEEVIYVPECIGLFSQKTLLFNNNKSTIYAQNGLYDITTFNTPLKHQNNGKNFELVKCNFDKIEVGSIIVLYINYLEHIYNYEIKINKSEVIWLTEDYTTNISKRKGQTVYKVVKI